MKTYYKISVIFISFITSISLCLLSIIFIFDVANASVDSNDKVYGETLTQRAMPVKYCPNITAKYACIMNKNGELLYERNSFESAKIASMTKILTAIVALENSDLNETLEINERAVKIGESSAGFWVGDKLDMKSTLYALMIPSGNDAAEAICEFVGKKVVDNKDDRIRKKSEEEVEEEAKKLDIDEDQVKDVYITDIDEAFCVLMNKKAEEIGCTNSYFTNPHGLDDDDFFNDKQHSCAVDMAKITRYAMQNDVFRTIVSAGDSKITVIRNDKPTILNLQSTDILLGNYEGCIGVKTGHTDTAGSCFSGAAVDQDGTEIYAIVMNSEDEAKRFIDAQHLFDWYFTHKANYKPSNSTEKMTMKFNDTEKTVGVIAYLAHSEWTDCKFPVTVEDQNLIVPILTLAGNVHLNIEPTEAKGNIKAGEKVAELVLTQHNHEIDRLNLVSIYDQPGPNIFQMIGVAIDRLFRNINSAPIYAETKIIANCDEVNKLNDI